MHTSTPEYSIDIRFEKTELPPFQEILILTKNSPHGRIGVLKSLELLVPDGFAVFEPEYHLIEAVIVSKRILKKVSATIVLKVLEEKVFPFISEGEIFKVDFKISAFYNSIELIK